MAQDAEFYTDTRIRPTKDKVILSIKSPGLSARDVYYNVVYEKARNIFTNQ